jgi:hypothetical protein
MKTGRKARTRRERYAAWLAMDETCPIYNCHMILSDSQLDHIVPLAIGGTDTWDNLIMVHRHINQGKSSDVYPHQHPALLRARAIKNMPKILKMLDDKNFSVPEDVVATIDPAAIEPEIFLKEVGATSTWTLRDIRVLVVEYISKGSQYLEWIATTIGKSVAAIRAKLVSLQIYTRNFLGKEREILV